MRPAKIARDRLRRLVLEQSAATGFLELSLPRVADELGTSLPTTRSAIRRLQEAGEVTVEQPTTPGGRRLARRYRLEQPTMR